MSNRQLPEQIVPQNGDFNLPTISIVTPSFNQQSFLEETILSVLSQGFTNLEYLIVDDCSTDGSIEIINKYEDRLTLIQNQENKGQADALNNGFLQSSGEILGTINGDDVQLPYTLNLVARIFRQFPEIDWITGHSSFMLDGVAISPRRKHLDAYNSKLMRLGFYTPWVMGVPQHISTFFRRSLYEKAGGYLDISLKDSLDIELWIRMAKFSAPVFIPVTLALMRQHTDQRSVQGSHSTSAYLEIEGQDRGFLPLRLRKIILWAMRHNGFRGAIRHTFFDGKAKRLNWNYKINNWEIIDCFAF